MTTPNARAEDLEEARAGDRGALDRLLARHHERLASLSERVLGPRLSPLARGSDLLQGAYLEILRGIRTCRAETDEQFVAWASRLIGNNARDLVRYYRAHRRACPEVGVTVDPTHRRQATPSAEVAAGEDILAVRRAIEELDPAHREVLHLCLHEGLTPTEAAPRLGRSPGSTRVLLCRARAALLVGVERQGGPDEPGREPWKERP